jgi:protein gp37
MNRTSIEWVKNPDGSQGYTWNPITGCLNGCSYCYARKLANGRLKRVYTANYDKAVLAPPKLTGRLPSYADPDPFYPRFWDDKCYEIVPQGRDRIKPRGVFVCDMSDLFGKGIPERWTSDVLDSIRRRPDWRFYLLTKQPQNLAKFSPFSANCWVGVSATNQQQFDQAIITLPQIEAKKLFISVEPLLSRIYTTMTAIKRLDWLIIGAQTKPYKPPEVSVVRELIEAADEAGIKVFLKNSLISLLPEEAPFYDICDEDPVASPFLRQEIPND